MRANPFEYHLESIDHMSNDHRTSLQRRSLTGSATFLALTLAWVMLPVISETHAAKAKKPQSAQQSKATPQKKSGKPAATTKSAKKKPEMTMDQFLDRLMVAESGGNDYARNSLSTATGSFQFIQATFLSVMRRHYPKRIENLNATQVLALRTDRKTARDAAKAYTEDNATHLAAAGHKPTFPHLRLAFLLGPGGATRILDAKPQARLTSLLGPRVIRANPWMARHTAQSLVARSAREVSLAPNSLAGIKPRRDPVTGKLIFPKRVSRRPRIRVRCNLSRPSCKRWLALKRRRLARKKSRSSRVARTKR